MTWILPHTSGWVNGSHQAPTYPPGAPMLANGKQKTNTNKSEQNACEGPLEASQRPESRKGEDRKVSEVVHELALRGKV